VAQMLAPAASCARLAERPMPFVPIQGKLPRMKYLRLFVLAAGLLTPGIASARSVACPQFFADGQSPALLNSKLDRRTTFLCNDAYAVLASGVTHGALWSAEHLTADSLAVARDTPRRGRFHADNRLPFSDQAQLSDYRRSGYDRGHMTPSGDMPGYHAQQQSFSLANMVPQAGPLNRGVWEGIESAVRDLAVHEGQLYVVTGAVFQGSEIQSIGDNSVLVPTQTWKAVYDPSVGAAGAYICTNTDTPACSTTSIAQLTAITDIDPFPALSERAKQADPQLPRPSKCPYNSSSRHEHRRHSSPSLLDQILSQ
jgi:endonuclease G